MENASPGEMQAAHDGETFTVEVPALGEKYEISHDVHKEFQVVRLIDAYRAAVHGPKEEIQ